MTALAQPLGACATGPLWALHHEAQPSELRSTSISLVNALGNLGGFVGPYVLGAMKGVLGPPCPPPLATPTLPPRTPSPSNRALRDRISEIASSPPRTRSPSNRTSDSLLLAPGVIDVGRPTPPPWLPPSPPSPSRQCVARLSSPPSATAPHRQCVAQWGWAVVLVGGSILMLNLLLATVACRRILPSLRSPARSRRW